MSTTAAPTLGQYRDQARKAWTALKNPKPADLSPYYEEAAKHLGPSDLAELATTFRELAPRWKSPIAAANAKRQAEPFQFMPALAAATDAALSASIERRGVIVPVVYDQHGHILDGHQRVRIATALGGITADAVKPGGGKAITKQVKDDAEAFEIARTLNMDRRHLIDIDQRREMVADLREQGHSVRAIAEAMGVGKSTVMDDLTAPVRSGHLARGADGMTTATHLPKVVKLHVVREEPAPAAGGAVKVDRAKLDADRENIAAQIAAKRITGTDGKSYPATKPKPRSEWHRKKGKISSTRILERLSMALDAECSGLELMQRDDLDRDAADVCVQSIGKSIRVIQKHIRRIR
jgi:ParB-like chromosome segregation protein Spo0J